MEMAMGTKWEEQLNDDWYDKVNVESNDRYKGIAM